MSKQQGWKWQYLLALVLALAVLLTPGAALADDSEESAEAAPASLRWSDDLSYVKYLIRNYAYYDIGAQMLNAKDVPSLIRELQKVDPWAQYFEAEEFKSFAAEIEGYIVGIGVYVDTSGEQLLVQGVIANSPAEKAGLKFGDIIVGVDKLSAPSATADELMAALSGEENSLVTIKYKRGGKIIEETMSRKRVTIPSMEYWLLEETIGYARIDMFTTHTGEELASAVQSLKKQGMQSLMIDLRDCPGGELDGALATCGVLAGTGPMLFFIDRDGWYSFAAVEEGKPLGMPLALLINGETASAAELVAANVQDSGAGMLIGVPSYGKGVMQIMVDLPSGNGIKFTTDKLITRGYQDVDAAGGVMPDIYVADEEAQRLTALDWLKEQMAQPAFLKFYVGLTGYSQGGAWQTAATAAAGAALSGGAAYVPLELTLTQLGWQREEREGIIYFSRGAHRLILDKAGQSLITASGSSKLILQGETLYLPAALLRSYGHTVTWNSAERSVRIDKQ